MAFAPIALTMPEYDRTLYAGYWLKAYEQGTTTPLNMATDATGGTTLVKAELDTQGFPLTAGSARFIPFIDGDYDYWMFPTEAEADANDTTNAIQLADNLNADPDSTGQLSLWDTNLTYNIPEIILGSDDNYYRSIIDSNSGNNPTSSPVQWELLSFGRIWNTNITYAIGDSVYGSDGHLYVALVSQSGNDPTGDATNWDKFVTISGTEVLDNKSFTNFGGGVLTAGTAQATTSGTDIAFTSIPSWAKRITISLDEVSSDGTGIFVIELGDSEGYETTGYNGQVVQIAGATSSDFGTTGSFPLQVSGNAADKVSGIAVLTLLDSATNLWSFSVIIGDSVGLTRFGAGSKALTGTLDRLRLTSSSDTFDFGNMNILYEG